MRSEVFAAGLVCLAWMATASYAQEVTVPSVAPMRLPAGTSVTVDAVLDEPFWTQAPQLSPLTLTEPVEGGRPLHATDIRVAYDRDHLYIGIICHDRPGDVRARQMARDADVEGGDVVELWVDTFNDQRFAFWFQISAGGSRGDGLLSDSGSTFNRSWDGIWEGRSRISDAGWEAEIAIPFKTLSFAEGVDTWGFNVSRARVVNGEIARWAQPLVAYNFFNLAEGGTLTGLRDIRQGLALDVIPYVKGGIGRDSVADTHEDDLDIGLDVSWRPTPATTLRFTTNTDFAETEVDERRVNLTRFPLFFPEKRDFFLEDAGLFDFGPGQRPFFSRTIGRAPDGAAIPILAGLKFTGRVGDWNVGLLETRVDDYESGTTDVSARTLGVVRVSRNLGGENSAGVILTHGRPDGTGDALTYGVDFRVGSSRFFGPGRSGSLWGYYVASSNESDPDGAAYGLQAEANSASWEHSLQAFRTDENYSPELGFVRRTGVDHYRYRAQYTWRGAADAPFRTMRWRLSPHFDRDPVGEEDRLSVTFRWLDLELQSEDSFWIQSTYSDETIDSDFGISSGVTVSAGEYEGTRHIIEFDSSERRAVTGQMRVEFGDFYSGKIVRTRFTPVLIPSRFFTWRLSYEDIRVDIDEGDFDTQLVSTNLDVSFDPDLSWANLVQYDTESEQLAWQSRVHYIVAPGRDLFLVGQFGWDRSGRESFVATNRDLVLKLAYTWRF